MSRQNLHPRPFSDRLFSLFVAGAIHAAILAVFLFSSGAEETAAAPVSQNTIFCRYIENGRLYQLDTPAADWQEAEERVCGAQYREVVLPGALLEGARVILDGAPHPVVLAQRESCSCSNEERVPILQDLSIVEAPRLGAETRPTALPRIINTPEAAPENVVTTVKNDNPPPKKDRKPKDKQPTIDDLLNSAAQFDDARPVSKDDPGGSADGSRLSNSATGKGDPYLQKVKATLDNSMRAPASVPKAQLQKLSAKVWVKIGDKGIVYGWGFNQKSGNTAFDNMIENTLQQFMLNGQKRFASPPQQWKLQVIPFTVNGHDIK